jgi:hypothetical protein
LASGPNATNLLMQLEKTLPGGLKTIQRIANEYAITLPTKLAVPTFGPSGTPLPASSALAGLSAGTQNNYNIGTLQITAHNPAAMQAALAAKARKNAMTGK